jgi:hypothetical protein
MRCDTVVFSALAHDPAGSVADTSDKSKHLRRAAEFSPEFGHLSSSFRLPFAGVQV